MPKTYNIRYESMRGPVWKFFINAADENQMAKAQAEMLRAYPKEGYATWFNDVKKLDDGSLYCSGTHYSSAE